MSYIYGDYASTRTPERALWLAVIELMLVDFCMARGKKDKRTMEHLMNSLDTEWLYFICTSVDVHPSRIKAYMRDEIERFNQNKKMKIDLRYGPLTRQDQIRTLGGL